MIPDLTASVAPRIYATFDEEVPMLKTIQNVFDFKQDIEIEGLGKESVVDFYVRDIYNKNSL